ncbi:MAG: galactokinase [Sarcina sp.]
MKEVLEKINKKFKEIFNNNFESNYFSPGRVNLIGEHTDYNGGNVFPCAINFGTYAAVRKRMDNKVRMYSMNFENIGIIEFDVTELIYVKKHDWVNYPKGVMWAFKEKKMEFDLGFDVLFFGNIPNGAGLSSSASLEVLTGIILRDLFGFDMDNKEIALLSQKAENKFIGVNCGIMDQYAVAMGEKDKALFLDTTKVKHELVDFNLCGIKIVIANTNKRRGLADSKYNERRQECEKAVEELKEVIDLNSLGELNEDEFKKYSSIIKSDVIKKRAKHAVYENRRTIKAVSVLKNKDIEEFGRLMNDSHKSLKEDYEVTGIELDTLVEAAQNSKGVLGARMTGAGFGGCAIALVKEKYIDEFILNVGEKYRDVIGYEATFYVAEVGQGARKL